MSSTDRLERAIRNLQTESALDNIYLPPQHLSDRMAQLHTLAVSLAIIDDYELVEVATFGIADSQVNQAVSGDTLFLPDR